MRHFALLLLLSIYVFQMDKASIIKDAIAYIENLHEQESRIREEVEDLESRAPSNSSSASGLAALDSGLNPQRRPRKAWPGAPRPSSPIEILEVSSRIRIRCHGRCHRGAYGLII